MANSDGHAWTGHAFLPSGRVYRTHGVGIQTSPVPGGTYMQKVDRDLSYQWLQG